MHRQEEEEQIRREEEEERRREEEELRLAEEATRLEAQRFQQAVEEEKRRREEEEERLEAERKEVGIQFQGHQALQKLCTDKIVYLFMSVEPYVTEGICLPNVGGYISSTSTLFSDVKENPLAFCTI